MKKHLFFLLIFIVNSLAAQDFKKKFSQDVCQCLKDLNIDNMGEREKNLQFGLCAYKGAMNYKKEVKKEFNIDIDTDINNNEKMKKFGEQVGMLLITECPDFFSKVMRSEDSVAEEEIPSKLISGVIKKIEVENFVVFHLVGEGKNLTKLYWVSTIDSDLDLPKEYRDLVNKKVIISYYTSEIFDAKINDYRNLNIIMGLKTDY